MYTLYSNNKCTLDHYQTYRECTCRNFSPISNFLWYHSVGDRNFFFLRHKVDCIHFYNMLIPPTRKVSRYSTKLKCTCTFKGNALVMKKNIDHKNHNVIIVTALKRGAYGYILRTARSPTPGYRHQSLGLYLISFPSQSI